MTKKERVLAAIEGRMGDIDRPPVSVWYHFGAQFQDGRRVGELEAAFFRHYDFDFLKMMNDYPWPLPAGVRAIETPADLARIGPLSMDNPSFREQLAALRGACALVGGDAFVIDTVFNPWGIARRTLRRHARTFLKEEPQKMLDWLASCTENLRAYIRAAAATGIGGVFFSVNGAEANELSDQEFDRFVRPFDLAALEAARSVGPFLVGHIHGKNLRMDRVIDYPVPVLNWSHLHDNESLSQVRRRTTRCLIGGMDEIAASQLTARDIVESVLAAAREAKGGGFIAGPGCAVPADIPPDLIRAPREAVETLKA
jgi:uroporphyrinogen decarboxylase